MANKLLNLSKKMKGAWLLFCVLGKSDDSLKLKYHHLCNLTKAAAKKARNAWWSAHVAESEKHAWTVELYGHGGSLIRELQLLRKSATKSSMSTLLARDGSNLTRDDDKLQRWVEHFLMSAAVSHGDTFYTLPALDPPSALSNDVCVNELSDKLTQEVIAAVIFQMWKGRAPGLDGILTEMLKFGGAESVCWMKTIADGIRRSEMVPSD